MDIDWVSCDQCIRWFYTDCVLITKERAHSAIAYICPNFVKHVTLGFLNFFFHFRYQSMGDLNDSFSNILKIWNRLPSKDKQVVNCFTYSILPNSPLFFDNVTKFFQDRGRMNPFNNFSSNSVLQVLCGSAVANYLPSQIQCTIGICKHLTKIQIFDTGDTASWMQSHLHKLRAKMLIYH